MRSKTKAFTKPKTAKASGVCSLCLSVRQLHKRDGYVHVHGFRNDPCKGSRLPPLSSVMTQQRVSRVISSSQRDEDSAEGRQSSTPADLHLDTGQGTTGSAEIEVDDGGVDGEANIIGHPRQRRGMVMKHIPKGARFACSKALTDILQSIIGKPSEIEHWNRLLCFTSNILKQPKRSGRRRNMANVVKKRIVDREFQRTDAGEEQDEEYEGKSSSARDLFLAAVNSKLEDGNIRAATRILCSQDHPVKATPDTFAAMQEKHPSDKWSSKLMDLPCVTHTVPYQASEKEVADAVRSFPAGSASGPDGLRPQHLLDLLNNQESSAAFLSSLTDFINVLLRGECPKQMREIMFGGSLIALSKKSGGLRPIVIGYTYRRLAAKCANRYALGRLGSFFYPITSRGGGPRRRRSSNTCLKKLRHKYERGRDLREA